ncbi:MAG TPA: hypothetical protein PKM21_17825 [Anaerolineales bacterium]|nr:hypothetical protein [Anaerolineales bacterium]
MLRDTVIQKILDKQDAAFRWGFQARQAVERPEYLYYSPNYKSTLWTLVLLADLKTPASLPQIAPSMRLISERFFDPEHGIFRLPGMCRFPIPCLNGNMIYLQQYFKTAPADTLDQTLAFFAAYQRFDDGGFKTPKTYPYGSNVYCYGKHTCYWGVVKLLKGISFIPKSQRSQTAQQLIEDCIDFVLHHQVCFRSHQQDRFLHREIGKLTFPNFYHSDFLEILWLLAREDVHDQRIMRALDLLRSKMDENGSWALEKPMNILVSVGQKDCANAFITQRAAEVLAHYGR